MDTPGNDRVPIRVRGEPISIEGSEVCLARVVIRYTHFILHERSPLEAPGKVVFQTDADRTSNVLLRKKTKFRRDGIHNAFDIRWVNGLTDG